MATLTQSQIDTLRNKGLSDDKIQAIALQRGVEVPKESFGRALIKSEIGFGQSIAGAIGGVVPSLAGGNLIEESNKVSRQIQDNMLKRIQEKRLLLQLLLSKLIHLTHPGQNLMRQHSLHTPPTLHTALRLLTGQVLLKTGQDGLQKGLLNGPGRQAALQEAHQRLQSRLNY